MKNISMFLLSAFVLLPLYSYGQSQKFSVTLESASLAYNNSVGNEWSTRAKANGRYLFRGDSVHVNLSQGQTIKLEAVAVEDEKYPDRGSNSITITPKDIRSNKAKEVTLSVLVREDRGRYAGNTAKWNFKFQIKLEQ